MNKLLGLMVTAWLSVGPAFLWGLSGQIKAPKGEESPEKRQPHVQSASLHPRLGRALLEGGVLITATTIDYWRQYYDFKEDWQFRMTWKDQRRRFFTAESPKFDSNSFWYNWSHAMAGGYYYSAPRANGFSNRASFLFSLGLSAFWECVSEWREIISINDMIFSSFGGPAFGEPLFQVSSFFSHREGILNQLACFAFSPFLAFNNWLDRKSGRAGNSGPEALWHRFRLFAGPRAGSVSPSGTHYRQFNLGLEMETNTVPDYGEAETFSRFLPDTVSSRIFLDLSYSPAGLEEFNLRTAAVLFGYGWQSLSQGEDGTVRGFSGSVGAGCSFETFRKRPVAWYDGRAQTPAGPGLEESRFWRPVPTRFTDKLSTLGLVGPVLQVSAFGPRLRVRWLTEAYFDFALINSLAYNRFTQTADNEGVKTTLLNWGYYYGLGATLSSDLDVDWRRWHLRGSFRYQRYGSIQGQDRFQFLGVVTRDFALNDSRLVWKLWAGYRVSRTPFELGLAAEGIRRRGSLLEIHEQTQEHRVCYQLSVLF
jgi:hypothetical protein